MNHPEVYAIADAGFVVGGRIGREYFGIAFVLFMIFVSASGILAIGTALNAVSSTATHHGACTAIFIAVAAIAGWMLASIRTLGKISWLGWIGLISIMAAILTLTIAVGVQERPYLASIETPYPGPWDKDLKITNNATFAAAMSAINSIVFAFAATPTYFGIISEMRDPRTYKKAMCISMGLLYIVYAVIGIVVYYYCGKYVANPALGSAGPTMKKVAYGIAIPALLVTLCIYSHVSFASVVSAQSTNLSACRQVLLRSYPRRYSPPLQPHQGPLDHLAQLRHRLHSHRLHHRLGHSHLRQPHFPRWCRHRSCEYTKLATNEPQLLPDALATRWHA